MAEVNFKYAAFSDLNAAYLYHFIACCILHLHLIFGIILYSDTTSFSVDLAFKFLCKI